MEGAPELKIIEGTETTIFEQAERLLSERIDESLVGEERFAEIVALMEELNDGTQYSLVNEIARLLKEEEAARQAQLVQLAA